MLGTQPRRASRGARTALKCAPRLTERASWASQSSARKQVILKRSKHKRGDRLNRFAATKVSGSCARHTKSLHLLTTLAHRATYFFAFKIAAIVFSRSSAAQVRSISVSAMPTERPSST